MRTKYLFLTIAACISIFMPLQFMMDLELSNLLIVLTVPFAYGFLRFSNLINTLHLLFSKDIKLEGDLKAIINNLTDMSNIARKDGILALERVKIDDPFLQMMINHCVDGADPEFLEETAVIYQETADRSRRNDINFLRELGIVSSVWGILLGVATLNTMFMVYGFIFLLVGFLLASIVARDVEERRIINKTITTGLLGIQKGVNPRMLREVLIGYDTDVVNGWEDDDVNY